MSITTGGPAGYSYQDDVTVWLVLAWRTAESLQVVADAGDEHEDATFQLTTNGVTRTIEVQMKTEKGPVDESLLAKWLAHYPAWKSTGSLLEQLKADDSRNVLFVVTAPCTAAVAELCITDVNVAQSPRPTQNPPLRHTDAKLLLDAFSCAWAPDKSSNLGSGRDANCKLFAKSITAADLREISRRIFIVSQLSQRGVRERASWILNREFHCPQGETSSVLNDLARLVRHASGTNLDIAKQLLSSASARGKSLLLPPTRPHITRLEEAVMFEELQRRHALLLTGLSNAGKTHFARSIATRFQQEGYNARQENDIESARRFLLTLGHEERICILDDPFGSPSSSQNAYQTLTAVRDTLADVAGHRKLIVTSRADVLRDVLGGPPWRIEGHQFHDLSVTDATLARSIWVAHADANNVDPSVISRVDTLLQGQPPDELLQPGQLRQLSLNIDGSATRDAWLQVARQDGKELGMELCRVSAVRDTLAALRMLASTTLPVDAQELFFVLSDAEELPGKDHLYGRTFAMGPLSETAAPEFPKYRSICVRSKECCEALDLLERRGLVERVKEGYRFNHPNYVEAAEQALRGGGGAHFQRLVQMHKRAIFCLCSRNAVRAADTLEVLFKEARVDDRCGLISTAFDAFQTSLFPAVRDRCLTWILGRRDLLDIEQHKLLLRSLRCGDGLCERVVWHEGEAWLDPRTHVSFSDPYSAAGLSSRFDAAPPSAHLAWEEARGGARLLPEFMWLLLYRQNPEDVDPGVLQAAFSYDEAFVRALAANVALKCHPESERFVQQVLSDDHPQVFAAGLGGLLARWGGQNDEARRDRLQQMIAPVMTSERATVVLSLLENFEEVGHWYNGAPLPAEPWVLLATSALRAVSGADRVDAVHLHYYAERVLPHVVVSQATDLLWAWIEWAERAVCVRRLRCYGASVGALWLLVTGNDASQRCGVVDRLLRQVDTEFFVTVVEDLTDGWERLDTMERQSVLRALDGTRPDARWAQAIVLTRKDPPDEVVARLLGSGEALQSMLMRRMEPVNRRLLDDCVRVWEDVGSLVGLSPSKASGRLITRLSTECQNPLFERALRLCLGGNTGEIEIIRWIHCVWLKLCCGADEQLREVLCRQLIEETVVNNADHIDDLWRVLLAATNSDATIERWAGQLEYFVEAIECSDHVYMLLTNERIAPYLWGRLTLDRAWVEFSRTTHVKSEMRRLVEILYGTNETPRLCLVHDQVLRILDQKQDDSLVERVRAARSRSIDIGFRRLEEVCQRSCSPLEDWVKLWRKSDEGVR